jgi:hypothetical protein
MPKLGCNFKQRLEHEAPLQHAWMRNCEPGGIDYRIPDEQNVDIDDAWAARQAANTSHFPFDAQQRGQQLQREKARLTNYGDIQKPGLIRHILRLGFIN